MKSLPAVTELWRSYLGYYCIITTPVSISTSPTSTILPVRIKFNDHLYLVNSWSLSFSDFWNVVLEVRRRSLSRVSCWLHSSTSRIPDRSCWPARLENSLGIVENDSHFQLGIVLHGFGHDWMHREHLWSKIVRWKDNNFKLEIEKTIEKEIWQEYNNFPFL